jgi:phosphoglycerol transferase MdoB-like AlkP superfamily enzyme
MVTCSYEFDTFPANNNYIAHGFFYPYIHSFRELSGAADGAYNDTEARALLYEYKDSDIPEDRKVNIVSVMLEAYTDLSRFPQIHMSRDIYGPLHELQSRCVSGELVDNIFAGGTINTERCFLTGFTELDEYSTDVSSFVWYLREQGYAAEGIHVGDGWFYERDTVNGYLGFENYYFLEDYEDSNRTDEFFFGEVMRLFEERDQSKPYFSFSVSYQNHGSYAESWTVPDEYLTPGEYSNGSYNIINNYLSGIYDTTRRISALADYFEQTDAPVVLVVFGDHMPWLGNGNRVYHELEINMDVSTPEGFYNLLHHALSHLCQCSGEGAAGRRFHRRRGPDIPLLPHGGTVFPVRLGGEPVHGRHPGCAPVYRRVPHAHGAV